MNESQEVLQPTNYYLFTVAYLINGVRKFADIPIYSHKLVFPKKTDVFSILCNMLGIENPDKEMMESFAVMNIYKFECREDYLSYIGELKIE